MKSLNNVAARVVQETKRLLFDWNSFHLLVTFILIFECFFGVVVIGLLPSKYPYFSNVGSFASYD